MSRLKRAPSGASNSASTREIECAWWGRCSPSFRNGTRLLRDRDGLVEAVAQEQVRVAALGSGQRGADEFTEQRRGTIGPTLELGMGLRPDPERVTKELDELDEATVGRHPRAPQPRLFELGAVLVVELVAMAVALRHDPLAVRVGDRRTRHQLR